MDIAGEIRAEMARQRIGVSDLADATGYSRQSLSRKLNSHTAFTLPELDAISHALGVPIWELLIRADVNDSPAAA